MGLKTQLVPQLRRPACIRPGDPRLISFPSYGSGVRTRLARALLGRGRGLAGLLVVLAVILLFDTALALAAAVAAAAGGTAAACRGRVVVLLLPLLGALFQLGGSARALAPRALLLRVAGRLGLALACLRRLALVRTAAPAAEVDRAIRGVDGIELDVGAERVACRLRRPCRIWRIETPWKAKTRSHA